MSTFVFCRLHVKSTDLSLGEDGVVGSESGLVLVDSILVVYIIEC